MTSCSSQDTTSSRSEAIPLHMIGPYDIICGRSSNSFNNVGNRRFRITIRMFQKRYQELDGRGRRKDFIFDLTKLIRNDIGFRFLKEKDGLYVDIGEVESRKKIGHALLDHNMKNRKGADSLKALFSQKFDFTQIPCKLNAKSIPVPSLKRKASSSSLNSTSTASTASDTTVSSSQFEMSSCQSPPSSITTSESSESLHLSALDFLASVATGERSLTPALLKVQ